MTAKKLEVKNAKSTKDAVKSDVKPIAPIFVPNTELNEFNFTGKKRWITNLTEMKERQRLHYHTLGVCLEEVGKKMVDKEENEFDFAEFITQGESVREKEKGVSATQWSNWYLRELKELKNYFQGNGFSDTINGKIASAVLFELTKTYTFK